MAVFHKENPIVAAKRGNCFIDVLAVGVGNEYLPERRLGNDTHDVGHAMGIELVENIVEQQQWRRAS